MTKSNYFLRSKNTLSTGTDSKIDKEYLNPYENISDEQEITTI